MATDPDEVEALRAQVRALNEQLRHLVRTEQQLHLSRRDIDRQLRRVRALNQFALEATSSPSVSTVMDLALAMLLEMFPYEHGAAFVATADRRFLSPVATRAIHGQRALRPFSEERIPIFESTAVDAPRLFSTPSELHDAPELRPFLERVAEVYGGRALDDTSAAAWIPVWHPTERVLHGALVLRRVSAPRPFHVPLPDHRDEPFLRLVAAHVAGATDNLLLRARSVAAEEQARHHSAVVQALVDATRALSEAGLDYNAVLDAIVRHAASVVGDACTLWLPSEEGVLSVHAVHHREGAQTDETRLVERLTAGRSKRVARTGAPIFLPNFMAVPVGTTGRILGVVSAARGAGRPPYGRYDLLFLQELAQRARHALDGATLYRHAQEAIQARDEFLSIASHELKTPLTSLTLSVYGLQRATKELSLPEVVVRKIDLMARQNRRLSGLVDQLLDVARIRLGRMELQHDDVEICGLVLDAVAAVRDEAARVGSTISVELPPAVIARCDRGRMEQVVANLLTNALKFGKGAPIAIVVEKTADRVRLSVRDGGIGIGPDEQARIFKRFERAVSARQFGGLGLGLYIVRQIVEAHGGTIDVQSQPGQGATFRVELPLT